VNAAEVSRSLNEMVAADAGVALNTTAMASVMNERM
jgi:hypothetical protein